MFFLKICPPLAQLERGQSDHRLNTEEVISRAKIRVIEQTQRLFATGIAETRLHIPDITGNLAEAAGHSNGLDLC